MYIYQHIVLGILISIFLGIFFPQIGILGIAIIFLSSILIDFDHYLYYFLRKKDLSLKNAYDFCYENLQEAKKLSREEVNKRPSFFMMFHGIEPIIILSSLSLIYQPFIFVAIGFAIHIVLDIIFQKSFQDRWDRISVIADYFKFTKMEQKNGRKRTEQ